jgi:hypothetical protein
MREGVLFMSSDMKHTPGPWFEPTESAAKYGFPRWDIIAKDGDGVQYIAKALPVEASKEKRQANARLIAAAPDLLSASNRLVYAVSMAIQEGKISADAILEHEMRAVYDAIAKAEGRS